MVSPPLTVPLSLSRPTDGVAEVLTCRGWRASLCPQLDTGHCSRCVSTPGTAAGKGSHLSRLESQSLSSAWHWPLVDTGSCPACVPVTGTAAGRGTLHPRPRARWASMLGNEQPTCHMSPPSRWLQDRPVSTSRYGTVAMLAACRALPGLRGPYQHTLAG